MRLKARLTSASGNDNNGETSSRSSAWNCATKFRIKRLCSAASGSTIKSGLATGELYLHCANSAYTDYEIRPVIADGLVSTTVYKDGPGVLSLGGYVKTYTGGTVVNGGTLQLALTGGSGAGVIRGALTINPGATAATTVVDALGYTAGSCVNEINVNGGTYNSLP